MRTLKWSLSFTNKNRKAKQNSLRGHFHCQLKHLEEESHTSKKMQSFRNIIKEGKKMLSTAIMNEQRDTLTMMNSLTQSVKRIKIIFILLHRSKLVRE